MTYTGFKEDIVVSEYTGQTEYVFTLETNGLTLKNDDGSYYLTDNQGEEHKDGSLVPPSKRMEFEKIFISVDTDGGNSLTNHFHGKMPLQP